MNPTDKTKRAPAPAPHPEQGADPSEKARPPHVPSLCREEPERTAASGDARLPDPEAENDDTI
jgi:hypothetical protein